MAIGNAKKKPARKTKRKSAEPKKKATSASAFDDRSTRLQLYVKDKTLVKDVKRAALEEEISLSQLWEEWATQWLEERK